MCTFQGSGTASVIPPSSRIPFVLAEYLSDRRFAVLRYDKRGIGPSSTVSDSNAWGNLTFNNLKQDVEKALSVLLQQPEVNATKKAILIGHSEGTNIPPRPNYTSKYNIKSARSGHYKFAKLKTKNGYNTQGILHKAAYTYYQCY